eukprot:SAG31_NODE_4393_length_3273_cov_2.562067_2_plen_85_part_00
MVCSCWEAAFSAGDAVAAVRPGPNTGAARVAGVCVGVVMVRLIPADTRESGPRLLAAIKDHHKQQAVLTCSGENIIFVKSHAED